MEHILHMECPAPNDAAGPFLTLGPAGRNADIFDFELSEAEMRSWIEMREMGQIEVSGSACTCRSHIS